MTDEEHSVAFGSTRATLGDLAESSRGRQLHASRRILTNRGVRMLPHICPVRARLTGLFEFALVVDDGAQGNRQHLYPICLVCPPK
jgi:hypothetical protein